MSLLTAAVAADPKPLKVYLMAGQSNMEGHAHARVIDYLGDDPATGSAGVTTVAIAAARMT